MEQSQVRLPSEVIAHLWAAVRRDEAAAFKSRQLGRRVVDLSEVSPAPAGAALESPSDSTAGNAGATQSLNETTSQ